MKEKELTIESSYADFKKAYQAKAKLIEREHEDFLFALGEQYDKDTLTNYKNRKIKAVVDNRIQPNIFLLTGLERQNRTDFKAFPEGDEDSLKAEITSALFKNAIKRSGFGFKSSEQFKDGITCGESHLELYLDYTYNILNGEPNWRKSDGNSIFPEPGFREYDFSDARYVFKLTKDLSKDDLISLYPNMKKQIESANPSKINYEGMSSGYHVQPRDYPRNGSSSLPDEMKEDSFDLLERYYKKWIEKHFIGDKQTGKIQESENEEKAQSFVDDYKTHVQQNIDQQAQLESQYNQALTDFHVNVQIDQTLQPPQAPIQLPQEDSNRFIVFTRRVPEIWVYAQTPGIEKPLADERAWFYPKWKNYPFIPYFARFSTAPLIGDESHLLVQGVVHSVKGVQEKHNKSESLKLLHLNTSTNSGWLTEEDSWVNPKKVEDFGATPGINLEYKKGNQIPQRIFPNPLSQGHAQIAAESAEAIKAILGINADLLAVQEGGTASGRAIALRQRQGLLMVQELFDNLSRTRQIAGKFLLSQLGEIYDTETSRKVLGESFLMKNFGVPVMQEGIDPATGQTIQQPVIGSDGQPQMQIDEQGVEMALAEILEGDLGLYDVSVGEVVSSETMRMANMSDLKEFAISFPGLISPDVLIEESQLPQSTKNKVISNIKNAQAMQQQQLAMAGAK